MRTKMPEFESNEEEGERPGTTDQQARDQDAEYKQRSSDGANERAVESNGIRQSASDEAEREQVVCNV